MRMGQRGREIGTWKDGRGTEKMRKGKEGVKKAIRRNEKGTLGVSE